MNNITKKFSKLDKKFMNLALNLAKKQIGNTSENPAVGCVIVKNNIILATGVTSKNGRPHAEKNAIDKASNLDGATIYITLEPCYHLGKTNPCVDLIIKNKIAKVIIATIDPDKRVNNKSIKKLKDNNIKVDVGLFKERAEEINRGFFKSKLQNKIFITLKLATSIDGKIATKYFDSKWITNEKSRKFGHILRSKSNAILVGANTVRKDNPDLNCRIEGLEDLSPHKIILSNSLNLDLNSKIFLDKKVRIFIATSNSNKEKWQKFEKVGIEIIYFNNLQDFSKKLSELGLNYLLIEGGANLATNFLKEDLIDEIYLFQANKFLGSDSISAIADLYLKKVISSLNFERNKLLEIDNNQLIILKRLS